MENNSDSLLDDVKNYYLISKKFRSPAGLTKRQCSINRNGNGGRLHRDLRNHVTLFWKS